MTESEKKIVENNFDRMREVLSNTHLPINVGDTTVGETYLREGDIFRLATALINEGFRIRPQAKWIPASTKPGVHAGMKCSECKARISYNEHFNGQHLYCHKCGAKMKIKEND